MSICEPGKWSCPQCHRTVTVHASEPDMRVAITAMQKRHADAHRAAAAVVAVVARLGFPNPLRPARQPRRKAS